VGDNYKYKQKIENNEREREREREQGREGGRENTKFVYSIRSNTDLLCGKEQLSVPL